MAVITRTLTVIVHSAEEGGYWGEVLELPGCVSQGETLEELEQNIREAIEVVLQVNIQERLVDLQLESPAAESRVNSAAPQTTRKWPTEGTGTWTVAH